MCDGMENGDRGETRREGRGDERRVGPTSLWNYFLT